MLPDRVNKARKGSFDGAQQISAISLNTALYDLFYLDFCFHGQFKIYVTLTFDFKVILAKPLF